MSIVLQGSTSGSVTLQEPAVAGTTVLTLPAVTGTVLTDTSPKAGNVIQVVNYTSQTSASTQSASFVTTGHAVSITPTSSSSKILIITNATGYVNGGGIAGAYTIYRNSTNLSSGTSPSQLAGIYNGATSGNLVVPISMTYLDSPATTSSTTYTVYFGVVSNPANTLYYGFNSGSTNSSGVVITAMEIAA